ncbi:diguanylate cyclase domain-containing protein [Candidatus Xianfuyuplasma coldseepsis]|uniref:Diguanylate cyclase n=1 Tax=Candidatus Xianfuyuplasma coldseepsis TaxID=2782163 RepID=A0A7L7KR65_9MOLU|nr:diguanylate cyclase [Xianfuyuplasma coldseepsis]QMS84909.1 diguanylate cyclase [Xianfuyuplasma coldseepsis]
MNPLLLVGIIAAWFIYAIIIKLTKKRKYDYSFIVAFVFLLAFGYLYFFEDFEGVYYTWYSYITVGFFAFYMIIDNSVLLFKKNVSEFDFHDLEQKLEYVSSSSELLRQRFISTIELLRDGISFRDGDQIFGSDRFIEIIGVKDNEIPVEDFENLIIKEDLVEYHSKLEKCSRKYPTYRIKYRIKKDGKKIWVDEHGKMIILHKKRSYISLIKPLDIRRYPESEVDVLNNLAGHKEMYQEMQRLHRKKNAYHFVLIYLTNIPKINEKYGREFGDLMMGEYLSQIRFKFIKDNQSLFRISGIKFGLIIKEKSKFDILDRALVGSGELFTMHMKFGGVTQTIYPNLGISESPYEGKKPETVLQEAEQALQQTFHDSFGQSFCFFNRK